MPISPEMPKFTSVDYVYIQDTNTPSGGSTGGPINPITLDTLGLQLDEDQFIVPSLSYWWVQHVVTATCTAGGFQPLSLAPKNSFPFLGYCQVRLDNQIVNNQQDGVCYVNNYQLLRRWSSMKEQIAGSTFLFAPPDTDAGMAQLRAGTNLITLCSNNQGCPTMRNQAASGITYSPNNLTCTVSQSITLVVGSNVLLSAAVAAATNISGWIGKYLQWPDGSSSKIISWTDASNILVDGTQSWPAGTPFVLLGGGDGLNLITMADACYPPSFNSGLFKRLKGVAFPGAYASAGGAGTGGCAGYAIGAVGAAANRVTAAAQKVPGAFLTTAAAITAGANTYNYTETTTAATNTWTINMQYPLPILSDVFSARGLMKNRIQLQILLNGISNAASPTVGLLTGGIPNITPTLTNNSATGICPVIVTPAAIAATATLPVGRYTAFVTGIGAPTRLYLKVVKLRSEMYKSLPLAIDREYMDFQYTSVLAQGPGSRTYQVTPGIPRPRHILLYCTYTGNATTSCNGIALPPQQQMICEEPAYSSLGTYFGGPNLMLTIGAQQAFQNQMQYVWEKYNQMDVVNFNSSGADEMLQCGLGNALDYRNSQQANITSINLSRCKIPLAEMGGRQIYLTGTLYSAGSAPVDMQFFLLFSRMTRFWMNGKVEILSG